MSGSCPAVRAASRGRLRTPATRGDGSCRLAHPPPRWAPNCSRGNRSGRGVAAPSRHEMTAARPAGDQARATEIERLCAAVGAADAPTLVELRRFLLDAMFPSMPQSVRDIVLPLFSLATLELDAIEQALP